LHLAPPSDPLCTLPSSAFGSLVFVRNISEAQLRNLLTSCRDLLDFDLFSFFDGLRINIINPLEGLWELIQELLQYVKSLKLGWDGVLGLFDISIGRKFPKVMAHRGIRPCTDACECGRYPTTAGGKYPPGIGIVGKSGVVVAPVHGVVLAADNTHVTISPVDPSWRALISVYNVRAEVLVGDVVYAGKAIGSLYNRNECGRRFSYHVSLRELPPAGENQIGKARYLDPTEYLHIPQNPPPLTFAIECDQVSRRGALNTQTLQLSSAPPIPLLSRRSLSSLTRHLCMSANPLVQICPIWTNYS
jgi:hypothetical protein